jgi:hypothetical protein
MLPYPPNKLQQNVQSLGWFAKAAKNHFNPISHVQNFSKFTYNLRKTWLPRELKVEAADAPFKISKAKKTAVRAFVGYV